MSSVGCWRCVVGAQRMVKGVDLEAVEEMLATARSPGELQLLVQQYRLLQASGRGQPPQQQA